MDFTYITMGFSSYVRFPRCTYIYHKNSQNAGKYTEYMHFMGQRVVLVRGSCRMAGAKASAA